MEIYSGLGSKWKYQRDAAFPAKKEKEPLL